MKKNQQMRGKVRNFPHAKNKFNKLNVKTDEIEDCFRCWRFIWTGQRNCEAFGGTRSVDHETKAKQNPNGTRRSLSTGAHVTIFARRLAPLGEAHSEILEQRQDENQVVRAICLDLAVASEVCPRCSTAKFC